MTKQRALAEEQAIGWLIRTRDPQFLDWDAFTDWLEADPEHARLYDAVALADEEIARSLTAHPATARPAAEELAPILGRHSRRWFAGWAVAASLAALIGVAALQQGSGESYRTAPGEQRTIALADGSRIALNGGTELSVDGREVRMAQGEALFTVVHDDSQPFTVTVGGATVRDVGTVFNIVRDEESLRVAVAEGEVIYNPDGENVRLPAGKALVAADADATVRVSDADPRSVGAWRQGRLVYDGATLAAVAADLARNLGVRVTVDRRIGARPFSGVLMLQGGAERALPRAAAVLGLTARRTPSGWVLAAN